MIVKRIPLMLSLIFFIGICVSGSYWGIYLFKPNIPKITVSEKPQPFASVEPVARLLGGTVMPDVNYQLKGVIAADPANQSIALISINGKPTQVYPLKGSVSSGDELDQVSKNEVLLMNDGVTRRVALPPDTSDQMITIVKPSSSKK